MHAIVDAALNYLDAPGPEGRAALELRMDAIEDPAELRDAAWSLVRAAGVLEEEKGHAKGTAVVTSDGGEHWKGLNMRGAGFDARLMRVIFTSSERGWAFGESGALYTTHDGGASWIKLQPPTSYLLLGGSFIDENSGWLAGAGATILQTSDGGETWHRSQTTNAAHVRFNAASFVNARLGWAVGSGGNIHRTIDGGRTWHSQTSGVPVDLLDVKFLDSVEGWAVGNEGTILHTGNGGLDWINERSPTSHPLERIFFTDRSHGWAVGFGGTIIAYNLSGRPEAPRLRR